MATYKLRFYTRGQIDATPPTDANGVARFGELFENTDDGNQDADGNNGMINPGSFSITGKATRLHVNDDDGTFVDDSTMAFDPQLLERGIDLDGDGLPEYGIGTNVEILYSYDVVGSDGSSLTVYAVGAGQNYLNDDFIGIVTSQPLKEGVTYTVVDYDPLVSIRYDSVLCFGRGTMIATPQGTITVEQLEPGDLVTTRDHGAQPIRWIGRRKIDAADLAAAPALCPIRIRSGALGSNLPERDLIVSPQHRILVRSRIAQRMFDSNEVLVAAKHLLSIPGIEEARDLQGVEYFHILFDRHEVIFSDGAETESLHPGPEALKTIGADALKEIFALFPELAEQSASRHTARIVSTGRRGRRLAQRHSSNDVPLMT